MPQLTIDLLKDAARTFSEIENVHYEPLLDGVDYGKTIGTYLESKFTIYLNRHYEFAEGNAALVIDIPGLNVDIKTTSDYARAGRRELTRRVRPHRHRHRALEVFRKNHPQR